MRAISLPLCYLLTCFLVCIAHAQNASDRAEIPRQTNPQETWRVKYFTPADDFPALNTYDLEEDQQGFLWLGTLFGLIRYDGYEFKHFLPDAEDPDGFGISWVQTLDVSPDGRLWIGGSQNIAMRCTKRSRFQVMITNRECGSAPEKRMDVL